MNRNLEHDYSIDSLFRQATSDYIAQARKGHSMIDLMNASLNYQHVYVQKEEILSDQATSAFSDRCLAKFAYVEAKHRRLMMRRETIMTLSKLAIAPKVPFPSLNECEELYDTALNSCNYEDPVIRTIIEDKPHDAVVPIIKGLVLTQKLIREEINEVLRISY